MITKTAQFMRNDLWTTPQHDLPPYKRRLLRALRVVILSVRGFKEDHCQLHASALTLYCLLSIVPVVAMAFGVAKGFGFEERLEQQILEQMPEQEAVLIQVVGFAKTMLDNTKGGLVAGIGIAVLFFAVLKVIGYIEESFNHIWKVKKGRPLRKKFSDYLSLMLIGPILIMVSGSVQVFVANQLDRLGEISQVGGLFALNMLAWVPYLILWLLFSFVYIFMPNTKVEFKPGIVAGIVMGTLYHFVQWAYVSLQVGVASYNAIYGSFAALPLFLFWLQLSWLIVLLGAELTYYLQLLMKHEYHPRSLEISFALRKQIALLLMHQVVKRFGRGESAMSADQMADAAGLPIRLARQLVEQLSDAGILVRLAAEEGDEVTFQPARDPDLITISDVIEALEQRGDSQLPVTSSSELEQFSAALEAFHNRVSESPENRLLKAMP